MNAGPSDADLVAAAQTGDRAAWGTLYRRYAPVVHGILLARAGVRPADADDLTQEVFIQAMRRLSDIREGASIGGWLIAIAKNAAISFARRPHPAPLAPHDGPAAQASPASPAESTEEAHRILTIIRTLPEAYREILILRLVEGLTGPELAARMGMTHGSIRVNLHRGMQLLKDRLGIQRGDEP